MRSLATSDGADRYPLDAVVAVAEVVPLGTLRLGISRLIGRTRTHVRCTRLVEASDKLPPAPAASLPLPLQTGLLPVAFADTDLDSRNRRSTRPRHTGWSVRRKGLADWNQCDRVSDGGVSGTRRATIGCDSCRTRMSIQYLSAIAAATFCFMSGISSTFTLSNSLSATFNFT